MKMFLFLCKNIPKIFAVAQIIEKMKMLIIDYFYHLSLTIYLLEVIKFIDAQYKKRYFMSNTMHNLLLWQGSKLRCS